MDARSLRPAPLSVTPLCVPTWWQKIAAAVIRTAIADGSNLGVPPQFAVEARLFIDSAEFDFWCQILGANASYVRRLAEQHFREYARAHHNGPGRGEPAGGLTFRRRWEATRPLAPPPRDFDQVKAVTVPNAEAR
jgi:hypothetical protein